MPIIALYPLVVFYLGCDRLTEYISYPEIRSNLYKQSSLRVRDLTYVICTAWVTRDVLRNTLDGLS